MMMNVGYYNDIVEKKNECEDVKFIHIYII